MVGHSLVKEDGALSALPGDPLPSVLIFHRTCRAISPDRIDGFGDVLRKEETYY